jgi:hypothetical protein
MEDILMADCHDLFQKFYDKIKLAESKKENLRSARDAIRDRIRNHFKEVLKKEIPEFLIQGSFVLLTVVNSLNDEFDIDDGVYLQNFPPDSSKWPSPETVHQWIYNAVKGHTQEDPIDKRTCVRVTYSGHYHVDLPIYCLFNQKSYLAEKGEKGWHESDPIEFTNWFINKVKAEGEQLRRIVCYLKAWVDFKSSNERILNSFILTILAINNFEKTDRDDVSFSGTAKNIFESMNESIMVINPVDSNEIVSNRISESQWSHFKKKLSELLSDASIALKNEDKEEASKIWRKEFGERFPESKSSKGGDKPLKTSAPAILGDDGRSA